MILYVGSSWFWAGKVELSIILCPADGDVSSDTLKIPNDVAAIVEKHSLVPFVAEVRGVSCAFLLMFAK